jgi:hypothetical protein
MNKTIKVALCIGLAGLGVFVWTHSATAAKPPSAPVVVTFLSGDVSAAAPVTLGKPFTATIDFARHIPYLWNQGPVGGEAVLNYLQTKNPITYSSLSVTINADPMHSRLDFQATIDGKPYVITMNAFISGTTESTPTLDTIHYDGGRFAVMSGKELVVVAGKPVLNFTMTK